MNLHLHIVVLRHRPLEGLKFTPVGTPLSIGSLINATLNQLLWACGIHGVGIYIHLGTYACWLSLNWLGGSDSIPMKEGNYVPRQAL